MTWFTQLSLLFALVVHAPFAIAQNTLGELLDAGAAKLSRQEFTEQVVQRMVAGPTPNGGSLEVMYATTGAVVGIGRTPRFISPGRVSGEWAFDDGNRVCSSMRTSSDQTFHGVILPPRCQFWLKLGDRYFVSDSDTDRSAKVLSRTIKQ